MRVTWGSYVHDEAEVAVQIATDPLLDQGKRVYGYTLRWTIRGEKVAATQAALITALTTLEAAYASGNKDLILYSDYANSTIAAQMLTAGSASATRVASGGVRYPQDGQGDAEYTTFRRFEVVVEADYHSGDIGLLAWQESLSGTGTGGPEFVYAEPLTGPPQKQQAKQLTPCTAVQRGSAIGRLFWPTPPAPIYPTDEEFSQRKINFKTPKREGPPGFARYIEFEVEWEYVFKRVGQFPVAVPNQWPALQ